MATSPQEQLNIVKEIQQSLEEGFRSLASNIQNVAEEIGNATDDLLTFNTIAKDITRTIRSISKANEDIISNTIKLNKGQLESKKIEQQIDQIKAKEIVSQNRLNTLQKELNDAIALGRISSEDAASKQAVIANLTAEIARSTQEVSEHYSKQLNKAIEIEKKMGNLGKLTKGLGKIPIVGQFIEADKVLASMQQKAADGGSKIQIMAAGFKAIGSSIKEGILDPLTLITFLLKSALTANEQAVKLGKSLGYGADRADEFRENLVDIERSTNNLNVTTKNLVEAYGELAVATGLAYEFSADQLTTQIKLTKQVGLTAEQAAQVQRFGVLNNKTSEETYRSFLKGITAARNQLKVGVDFKATLAEAVMVSGQLAANLGNNPEVIGKAIVTAKALGMTLEQVSKAGSTLLDFGSSISSELEAELLTGKQINLERARAAALAGDQITLAEELAKNMGTSADFTKMNVLQQQSLAKSVGMTADELANTLRKREEAIASGKSLAQITEEEAAEALERQSVQDKFNAAIEKLQSLIGNILAGPLGTFLNMLSGALNIVNYIGKALSFLATPLQVIIGLYATLKGIQLASLAITKTQALYEKAKYGFAAGQRGMAMGYNGLLLARQALLGGELTKTIAIAAAWAVANPLTALAGLAIAGTVAAGLYALTADDMVDPGYGKRTLLSPEGSIKLNDNDTVIAGTNLGGGGGSMPQIDLTPMIMAINEVRSAVDRLYSKDQSINMDGKKVGTTLVQGSYKVA